MNQRQSHRLPAVNLTVFLLVVLLLSGLLLAAVTAQAQGGTDIVTGGDEAALREFIARVEGFVPGVPTTILIDSLPDPLPFDMPLVPGAEPVGSIQVDWGADETTRLVITTPLTPEEVMDFYSDSLSQEPWRLFDGMVTGSSGLEDGPVMYSAIYCHETDGTVNVNAQALPSGETDVQIYVTAQPDYFMCMENSSALPTNDARALLPRLSTPEGATWRTGTTASDVGTNDTALAITTATIASEQSATDLLNAYNNQLETAGWEPVMTTTDTTFAWSGWLYEDAQDHPWSGTLTVTANPGQAGEYHVTLKIEQVISE